MSKNYYNEELHIKLVKNYMKSDAHLHIALRHILSIENQSLFDASKNWYSTLVETLEACKFCMKKSETPSSETQEQYELVNLVYLTVQYHHILLSLSQSNRENFDLNLDLLMK